MASSKKTVLSFRSLTVYLRVVEYREELMLYDPVSKRATTVLRASDLPVGTKLTLLRHGQKVGTGKVLLTTGHGPFKVFSADSLQLVEPEGELEHASIHRALPDIYHSKKLRAQSGLLKGDKIKIVLVKGRPSPLGRATWQPNHWFRHATHRNKRAAYDAIASEAAWDILLLASSKKRIWAIRVSLSAASPKPTPAPIGERLSSSP